MEVGEKGWMRNCTYPNPLKNSSKMNNKKHGEEAPNAALMVREATRVAFPRYSSTSHASPLYILQDY